MLGLHDVGAAQQHVRTHACGHVGQGDQVVLQRIGQQLGGHGRADEQGERVDVLGHGGGVGGDASLGLLQRALGLAHVQIRGQAAISAGRGDVDAVLVGGDRLLGHVQPVEVGGVGDVGGGDMGDQADLLGALRLFGGEVLLQRLTRQAAHPAPKIELVIADAKRGFIGLDGEGLVARRHGRADGPGGGGRHAGLSAEHRGGQVLDRGIEIGADVRE